MKIIAIVFAFFCLTSFAQEWLGDSQLLIERKLQNTVAAPTVNATADRASNVTRANVTTTIERAVNMAIEAI